MRIAAGDFRCISARCRLNSVDGLTTIAERMNRRGRIKSAHNPTTTRSEGRRWGESFSGPIEDEQLVLDEYGFRHHGTGAAGTREPRDCRQQTQKEDGQIAHRSILAR